MKNCPFCGASIHEEASFCPCCARTVNQRERPRPPRWLSWRARWGIALTLAAAVALLAVWLYLRPRTYDTGTAEVLYPDKDGTYQFCIAWADAPFTPCDYRESSLEMGDQRRYPVLLYMNHAESDSVATRAFLDKWEYATAEIVRADEALQISCTKPEYMSSYVEDAAVVTFIDYAASEPGDWSAELVITVHMKNGDTVRVHQKQLVRVIPTYTYTSEDTPLDTLEDLRTLLDQIGRLEEDAVVNIILPPVTYEGTLQLDQPVNLTGSEDSEGNRTTFTGPVQVFFFAPGLVYFEGIDFIGSGDGVGVSSQSKLFLTDCRIAGWKTGVLAYGQHQSWINADECVFEDNDVGFHFNLQFAAVTDSRFENDLFQDNGTAVLLEHTGTDISVKFPGASFVHNGTDIDNRCGQPLELDGATFE